MKKSYITLILSLAFIFLHGIAFGEDAQMCIEDGNYQSVQVGRKFSNPLKVRVFNKKGNLKGIYINFSLIKGEGRLNKYRVVTNSKGLAYVYFVSGYSKANVVIKAETSGIKTNCATFKLKVVMDNPNKNLKNKKKFSRKKQVSKEKLITNKKKVASKNNLNIKSKTKKAKTKSKAKTKVKTEKKRFALVSTDPSIGTIIRYNGNYQKICKNMVSNRKLVVQLIDKHGMPIEGALVKFFILKGSGKILKPIVYTNSKGLAITVVKGGNKVGPLNIVASATVGDKSLSTLLYASIVSSHKGNIKKIVSKNNTIVPTPKKLKKKKKDSKKTPEPIKKEKVKIKKPKKTLKPVPAVIIGFKGNNQRVLRNKMAPKALEVQVMDEKGEPIKGQIVKFMVVEGEGKCTNLKLITDKNGIASTKVKAGNKKGNLTIKALVKGGGEELSTVVYLKVEDKKKIAKKIIKPQKSHDANIKVSNKRTNYIPKEVVIPKKKTRPRGYYSTNPVNISIVGGNYQKADPGARLPQPIVVYITDGDGNPAGATVQFTVLSGDATLTNRQVRTDDRGLASVFAVINSSNPIRIVAEVMDKPGLATIAYANVNKPGNQGNISNPVIKSQVAVNKPGYPATIAFFSMRSKNIENIEKTKVIPMEIGVTDFRNQPVSSAVRFTVKKGKVLVLNPVVTTNSEGRGICYVDVGNSMGIFTIEAQSLENPDLKAEFRAGPQINTGPSTSKNSNSSNNKDSQTSTNKVASNKEPALIAIINGGGQLVRIGQEIKRPIEVIVTDNKGLPVIGSKVKFKVLRGSAKLYKKIGQTDAQGKVFLNIKAGRVPGIIEIIARSCKNRNLKASVEIKVVN